MSLVLSNSKPPVSIKTHGVILTDERGQQTISFGDYSIPMDDFMEAVVYVFTNSDLLPNDPRLECLNVLRKIEIKPGHNPDGTRLG